MTMLHAKGDGQKNTQNRQELHMYDWIQNNLWILKSISNHLKTMGFSFYKVFSMTILVYKKLNFSDCCSLEVVHRVKT